MRCFIYNPQCLRMLTHSLVGRMNCISTLAWGFSVARFDLPGNVEPLNRETSDNELCAFLFRQENYSIIINF